MQSDRHTNEPIAYTLSLPLDVKDPFHDKDLFRLNDRARPAGEKPTCIGSPCCELFHSSGTITLILVLIALMTLVFSHSLEAQHLQLVSDNDGVKEYVFANDSLEIRHAFEWVVRGTGSVDAYVEVTELNLVTVEIKDRRQLAVAYALEEDSHPVFEVKNSGLMRGQRVQSLVFHPARVKMDDDQEILMVRSATFTVYERSKNEAMGTGRMMGTGRIFEAPEEVELPGTLQPNAGTLQPNAGALQPNAGALSANETPFRSGTWIKIPIPEPGIYEIDTAYLAEAGLETTISDPRRFQMWGMRGGILPERNDQPRPSLQQIPVIITGEQDGVFNEEDKIIFYADGPDQVFRDPNSGNYTHQTHPYSDVHHLFFTPGDAPESEPGVRLIEESYNAGDFVIDQTREVIVLEKEEFKSENKIKSGRIWFSDRLTNTTAGRSRLIVDQNIPGLQLSEPVTFDIQLAGRSLQPLSVGFSLNGEVLGARSINPINSYSSEEGLSARMASFYANSTPASETLQLEATLSTGDVAGEAFFDWIRMTLTRSLKTGEDGQLIFHSPLSAAGSPASYRLQGFDSAPLVMEISNPVSPVLLDVSASGANYVVNFSHQEGHRFIAQSVPFRPLPATAVPSQNLRGETLLPDYIILTTAVFLEEAQEWASYRREKDNLQVLVAVQEQIFNEFSGGTADVTALRDFVKFHYDRALDSDRTPLQNLLLFGGATFDYKNLLEGPLPNHLLTYQSVESLHRINSYGSDDYFGLLDDTEGNWSPQTSSERIDVGIGRFPVTSAAEARALMQKIRRYEETATLGDWRNRFVFVADDDFPEVDRNRDLHALNADGTAVEIDKNATATRVDKIYMLSYPVENSAEGRRLPAVTTDLIRAFNEGALVVNYSGHGGQFVLSDEKIFTVDDVPLLTNRDKATIFVTATCQFGRYDDHESLSGAEETLLWDEGGTVAALTTTRVVYTSSTPGSNNFGLNIQLTRAMLEREDNGRPRTLGDIYRLTKNTSQGAGFNARKFILLGDPATRIGLPQNRAAVRSINGVDLSQHPDTVLAIRALDRVRISGFVAGENGEPMDSFSGEAAVKVFDAERNVRLPNLSWVLEDRCFLDDCQYTVENDVLFNGRSTIQNGEFNAEFIVPADINFSENSGRILIYASSGETDASVSSAQLLFNGINPDAEQDSEGPVMDVYLNDPAFVNGNLVGSQPTLLVDLEDPSGINTTGTGIGHEMIATIDTTPQKTFVLNEYYTSEPDQFQRGRIEYPLEALPSGSYRLNVRTWDVFNNASEKEIQFDVAESRQLEIRNVYNYPNPMSQTTRFVFEHNQPGNVLDIDIRIYTLSGMPVTELTESQITSNAYAYVEWNGLDRNYDRLANGTYLYVLRVGADTEEGRQTREKIEKFVIIR